jgi:hypothetical protein
MAMLDAEGDAAKGEDEATVRARRGKLKKVAAYDVAAAFARAVVNRCRAPGLVTRVQARARGMRARGRLARYKAWLARRGRWLTEQARAKDALSTLRANRSNKSLEQMVERRLWAKVDDRDDLEGLRGFRHTGWRPAYALDEEFALVKDNTRNHA